MKIISVAFTIITLVRPLVDSEALYIKFLFVMLVWY